MLAEILSGERDAAEIFFGLAAFMFLMGAIWQRNDEPAAVALVGWCVGFLGFFVL